MINKLCFILCLPCVNIIHCHTILKWRVGESNSNTMKIKEPLTASHSGSEEPLTVNKSTRQGSWELLMPILIEPSSPNIFTSSHLSPLSFVSGHRLNKCPQGSRPSAWCAGANERVCSTCSNRGPMYDGPVSGFAPLRYGKFKQQLCANFIL